MTDEFKAWLGGDAFTRTSLTTSQRKQLTSRKQRTRKQTNHDYRLFEPRDVRAIPAGLADQTDMPRKRHKLAQLRKPRTSGPSSECVSYMPDGTASIFKPTRTYNGRTTTRTMRAQPSTAQTYERRLAQFGATGDVD